MTDVAVVMPCYNGLPYLRQALDSALAQTVRPAQIIVVDDGSRDQSPAVVREYIAAHPDRGIQLLQQANAGEPAARNAGIAAATATWVAQLDADDWWEPTKLERQLAAAAAAGPECVLVHTGAVQHFPDGRDVPLNMGGCRRRVGWATQSLLEPESIAHPSILVRRDALATIGGYDRSFKQACDIDLYFRLSAVGTFAFVPEYLLHYRVHAKQMSASQIEQIPYHHRAIRKFFASHPDIEARIGPERIAAALADHVATKLEFLYWRRRLDEFRQLLDYAAAEGIDSPKVAFWRRRARWPDWAIRLRDRWRKAPAPVGAAS